VAQRSADALLSLDDPQLALGLGDPCRGTRFNSVGDFTLDRGADVGAIAADLLPCSEFG
jgi:hypothetical protein